MPHSAAETTSRPTAEWLVTQHALGKLPRAASLLTEAYLDLNPSMATVVRRLDEIGGWSIEHVEPVELGRDTGAAETLAKATGAKSGDAAPAGSPETLLPASLAAAIGQPLSTLAWKWRGRGAYEYRLKAFEDDGVVARLLRIEPGRAMPQHTHGGLEATLVLRGAYRDSAGRFAAGDLELANDAVDHKPVAEPGGTCICFAVNEAPMKLTGPIGRFLQSLI